MIPSENIFAWIALTVGANYVCQDLVHHTMWHHSHVSGLKVLCSYYSVIYEYTRIIYIYIYKRLCIYTYISVYDNTCIHTYMYIHTRFLRHILDESFNCVILFNSQVFPWSDPRHSAVEWPIGCAWAFLGALQQPELSEVPSRDGTSAIPSGKPTQNGGKSLNITSFNG